jgi:menaquinone-dependent protoporphyrinogen oxidase
VRSGFFSVNLLQASTRARSRDRAAAYLPRFLAATGWTPDTTASFAGAMTYTRFGWFGKRLMRIIWRREGIGTDLGRDHEYTRWEDVDRFADSIEAMLSARDRSPRAAAPTHG